MRHGGRSRIVEAAAGGFVAGALAMAVIAWGPVVRHHEEPRAQAPPVLAERSDPHVGAPPPPAVVPLIPPPASASIIDADPVPELRDRGLELPVSGVVRQDLRDSFLETRGSDRSHEAIDIMAPRNTPILAVEDGVVARLFESKAGGTTVYQFDPSSRFAYYYAHLERYADGLQEGTRLRRGQVLGYVGTSGNAPKNTPHLHFAIFRLTDKKQWWHGSPIDPYQVLK